MKNAFVKELIKLSGVSKEYADSAWYTLNRECVFSKDVVKNKAKEYVSRFIR